MALLTSSSFSLDRATSFCLGLLGKLWMVCEGQQHLNRHSFYFSAKGVGIFPRARTACEKCSRFPSFALTRLQDD